MKDPGYLDVRSSLDTPITRTVEVGDAVNVDLNDAGEVIGVEKVFGPLGFDDLVAVLRALPFRG